MSVPTPRQPHHPHSPAHGTRRSLPPHQSSRCSLGSPQDGVERLSEKAASAFLERHSLGRLAYHVGAAVHIVPVTYAAMDGQVIFRTGPGSKLVAVILNSDVAFEVDEIDHASGRATSVVARGVASRLTDLQVRDLGSRVPRPWVSSEKAEVVAIRLTSVTGRSFARATDD